MDFHKIDADAFTEEDSYKAHLKDVAIQNKHGLLYKKYYLNLEQKTAFCLIESPSKGACIESHLEAHGIGACHVIEVSKEHEFLPFLGEGSQNDKDLALTLAGEIDSGYRTIMLVDCLRLTAKSPEMDTWIADTVKKHKGSKIRLPSYKVMASFINADDAINCALDVEQHLLSYGNNLVYGIALATGKPVDEHKNSLFANTKEKLKVLALFGFQREIYMDMETKLAATRFQESPKMEGQGIRIFDQATYQELQNLEFVLSKNLSDPNFTATSLVKTLGWSRSQAYRKITSNTGVAPKQLMSGLRMVYAAKALRKGNKSISEVAYAMGFNSPTYFTRAFRKWFDILPSSVIQHP